MRKFRDRLFPLLSCLSLACLWTLLSSCGAIGFDVSQDLPEQKVQGAAINPIVGLLPFIGSPVPITVDLRAETAARSTGPAKNAFLKSLSLTATPHNTPSGNFDFLTEVHIYIEAKNNGSLAKVEIATLKPVPAGKTQVDFAIVANVDLLPYINAGAQITASATGTQPMKDFTYDGHIVITVHV